VASGRLDATVSPFTDPKLELPAGCLMVEEAGGKSTDFSGKRWDLESPNIVATNGKIYSVLLELLKE
jgi:myo-inositol-1(or 4)-monophosphatase